MAMSINVICTNCGRELFRNLTLTELRDNKEVDFGGFHLLSINGRQEEICNKCYDRLLENGALQRLLYSKEVV